MRGRSQIWCAAVGRHFPPNFYYNQEDYLASRVAEDAPWTYNVLRPGPICGLSHGSFMNVVTSTALYCTLCKELNLGALRCVLALCGDSRGQGTSFIISPVAGRRVVVEPVAAPSSDGESVVAKLVCANHADMAEPNCRCQSGMKVVESINKQTCRPA